MFFQVYNIKELIYKPNSPTNTTYVPTYEQLRLNLPKTNKTNGNI